MIIWKAVLLVFPRLDARLPTGLLGRRLRLRLDQRELAAALESFEAMPALVREYSEGEAAMVCDRVLDAGPITSLTAMGAGSFWPSPADTRAALDHHAPVGRYDSVFVLWPQRDPAGGGEVPTGGWGLALGASAWSNGATYVTVANAPPPVWREPVPGEVWLHEWLHGACAHFAGLGYRMPEGDADGASRNGYRHSPTTGWSGYYRDLMTGRVGAARLGIPAEAWRRGTPLGAVTD